MNGHRRNSLPTQRIGWESLEGDSRQNYKKMAYLSHFFGSMRVGNADELLGLCGGCCGGGRLELDRDHVEDNILVRIVEDGALRGDHQVIAVLGLVIEGIIFAQLLDVHDGSNRRLHVGRNTHVRAYFFDDLPGSFPVLAGVAGLELLQADRELLELILCSLTAVFQCEDEHDEPDNKDDGKKLAHGSQGEV